MYACYNLLPPPSPDSSFSSSTVSRLVFEDVPCALLPQRSIVDISAVIFLLAIRAARALSREDNDNNKLADGGDDDDYEAHRLNRGYRAAIIAHLNLTRLVTHDND